MKTKNEGDGTTVTRVYGRASDGGDSGEEKTPGERIVRMLSDPPEWLATQLAKLRTNAGLFEPTCAAIAAAVLGDGRRGEEVVPVLRAHLEEGSA